MARVIRSVFRLAADGLLFGLVVLGVAGVMVQVFREHGWLDRTVARAASLDGSGWLLALGALGCAALAWRRWSGNADFRFGNLLLYLWAGLGIFFAVRLML